MGTLDRTIRTIVGTCVIIAGFYFQSWWGLLGLVPFTSGVSGWCPAYIPFGISSCKMK